ncbi:MAG: hypothetical protein MUW56_03960 [Chryseobacterium sp.]|uniref:Uncharacterized protein n=2 Tax=Chryseobacterium pennae TaxID=2258962 RepID=A0A3D9C2X5_9FLAO|nr:hypothetical protein [Chryseobacterium sp.]MCJ7932791.1 hypothetical protein [Chryseobacterium sp.]REC60154.1 hypothetical protein DRF65_22660 [Chryseobacterium pennae]
MKKEMQSKKSLESLKGKKLGDLKSVYAGSLSLQPSDASMLATTTIMNNGGTADDGCDDKS